MAPSRLGETGIFSGPQAHGAEGCALNRHHSGTTASSRPVSSFKEWEKLLHTPKGWEGNIGQLLTISVRSNSRVMLSPFLRHTANSCKKQSEVRGAEQAGC